MLNSKMEKGQEYKGFVVQDVVQLTEMDAVGIRLLHTESGLEVFHILNDDPENLFAFAFRTPSRDSSGEAHVLEHSVLCGSKNYPVKDPFLRLSNQSINTYLNAYTSCDRTVFPASSLIKQDYWTMMSVYADAVFFPLLDKNIFLQECCRVEDGEFQGVVYNEMKGNYSSFDMVANDICESTLVKGTSYAYDSGGDPMEIPFLTVEKLREFHNMYYCTRNCLVFLYGDIPTVEQLDFLVQKVIDPVKASGKGFGKAYEWGQDNIEPSGDYVRAFGPGQEENPIVCQNWRIGRGADKENPERFAFETMFFGDLLWGDDCAPVRKALLESGLASEIALQTGESIHSRYCFSTIGVKGCKVQDASKVKDVIFRALEDICNNGVSQEDINRTAMNFNFMNREIKRIQGPFSLVLLKRVLRSWTYGNPLWSNLFCRRTTDNILADIKNNPDYVADWIRKNYLQNKATCLVSIESSPEWEADRSKREKENYKAYMEMIGEDVARENLESMKTFQNSSMDLDKENLIPRTDIKNLDFEIEKFYTESKNISGIGIYENEYATNGILYGSICFPADTLSPEDMLFMPTLADVVSQTGWGGRSWSQTQSLVQGIAGGFGAYTRISKVPDCSAQKEKDNPLLVGRAWVVFNFKVLEENIAQAFDLFKDCFISPDFDDKNKIKELVDTNFSSIAASFIPGSHIFAMLRTTCKHNRALAIQELWEGISSFMYQKKVKGMDIDFLADKLKDLFEKLQQGGCVMHFTGARETLDMAESLLPEFIERTGFVPLKEKFPATDQDYYDLTEIPGQEIECSVENDGKNVSPMEIFVIPGTVGFAGCSLDSAAFGSKDAVSDEVFAHCLQTSDLWQQIRTKGGAYGVFLSTNSDSAVSRFVTYRDPKPFESLESFEKAITSPKSFDKDQVEKAVTGNFSGEIEPHTPVSKGATAFLWELYGMSNDYREDRIKSMLAIDEKDIDVSAQRFSRNYGTGKKVVICPKSMIKNKNICGKIINLPL